MSIQTWDTNHTWNTVVGKRTDVRQEHSQTQNTETSGGFSF